MCWWRWFKCYDSCENKGKWMIGVDVDQSSHSTRVITSAMKDLTDLLNGS